VPIEWLGYWSQKSVIRTCSVPSGFRRESRPITVQPSVRKPGGSGQPSFQAGKAFEFGSLSYV
jgi:hypothetical protein